MTISLRNVLMDLSTGAFQEHSHATLKNPRTLSRKTQERHTHTHTRRAYVESVEKQEKLDRKAGSEKLVLSKQRLTSRVREFMATFESGPPRHPKAVADKDDVARKAEGLRAASIARLLYDTEAVKPPGALLDAAGRADMRALYHDAYPANPDNELPRLANPAPRLVQHTALSKTQHNNKHPLKTHHTGIVLSYRTRSYWRIEA
jgi:hypothetical protein